MILPQPETIDNSSESLSEEPEDLSSLNDFGDAPLQENQCVYELKISSHPFLTNNQSSEKHFRKKNTKTGFNTFAFTA